MGFENPTYLWGLLFALIPLILHLIARRRARVHNFAAMAFILASNKRIARRLKLKQLLLLLVRMLLVAAIAVAFAKPFTVSDEVGLAGSNTPQSMVLVIDPSFSMGMRLDGESLLDKAKDRARDLVAKLRNDSDAAVVQAGSPARATTQSLTYDRSLVKAAIETIELVDASADLQGALRLAEQILATSNHPRHHVVILSDMQATEWAGITRPWALDKSPEVTLLNVSSPATAENIAVTKVEAVPESGSLGREVRVKVEVLNDRPQYFDDVVTVRLGNKTAKGILKIPPRKKGTKEFTVRLSDLGLVTGFVDVPSDDLSQDNTYAFVVDFVRRIHVLVVNGSARDVPYRDETFFLRAALSPVGDSGSQMSVTWIKPDALTAAQLQYVDVVMLANVAELEQSQAAALLSWTKRGGGLFMTAGENVVADTYNERFADLLPLPIRDLKSAGERPLHLTGLDASHPVMEVFAQLPDASLYSARFQRYALLDAAASHDVRVLASYTDGAPAIVERGLGTGRVMMFTSTIDRDWTDLPFKTSFLPLLQQITLHLSSKSDQRFKRDMVVGDTVILPVGRDVSKIEIIPPGGETRIFENEDLSTGKIRYHETNSLGVYKVLRQRAQGISEDAFAVHLEQGESQLKPADLGGLKRLLKAGRSEPVPDTDVAVSKANLPRSELWPAMLMALFLLLGVETWLAFTAS